MVTFLTAGLKEKTESLIHLHFGDSVSVSFKKVAIPAEVKFHAEKKAGLRFMKKHIYTLILLGAGHSLSLIHI